MPGENLTRVEAEERAAIVQPSSYDVELDLTRGPEVFGSQDDRAVHRDARRLDLHRRDHADRATR